MFQLTRDEYANLKSQFVTSRWGGIRRATPYAFTEHGIAMLSSVLRSKRAVQVDIEIMRTFVRLRRFLSTHRELAAKLEKVEQKHDTHDRRIKAIFNTIRQLMTLPEKPERKIGFRVEEPKGKYRVTRAR